MKIFRWLRELLCTFVVCPLRGHRPRPFIPLRDDEPFIAHCCCGRLSAIDPKHPWPEPKRAKR